MSKDLTCAKHSQLLTLFVFTALLLTIGCGGGSTSQSSSGSGQGNPPPPPPQTSSAQFKIGDAPADRVLSFEVTVGPVSLTPTSGSAVTVLSGTRRLELAHLSGTNEPLALLDIAQGTYSSALIAVSNPEVTFVNGLGAVVKLQPPSSQTISVNFNPALTVGNGSTVVSIDLNVGNSLTFDAQGNVASINLSASSFNFGSAPVAAEDKQGHDDGELEDTTGIITAVNGSSFILTLGQSAQSLTFSTDASTQFDDGASLVTNTIVTVEGVTKADGSLYAKEVEGIEDSNGAETEGLITQVNGAQITFVDDHGIGNGMDDTKLGENITSDLSSARYRVKKGNIDTSGLGGLPSSPNFPFDATTIHAGQRVEVESESPMDVSSISGSKVQLQQQAVVGTVSGLSGATTAGPTNLTLTVASDSAFAILSGKTQINVFWQPGTDLHKLSSVNNGDTVRVRGLVFFTGTSFNMIARRIDQ